MLFLPAYNARIILAVINHYKYITWINMHHLQACIGTSPNFPQDTNTGDLLVKESHHFIDCKVLGVGMLRSISFVVGPCRPLWTDARQGKKENLTDTPWEAFEEAREAKESMKVVNSDDVIVEIQYSYESRNVLSLPTYQYLTHGVSIEKNGTRIKIKLMGAKLSKFSKLGHIQTFQGVLVQENQIGDESDHFSDESETFYSDFYVYENIVNIETDSN